jgi:DNA replication protein DnaC
LCYERYLLELVNREREERNHTQINRLLRESGLPLEKNIESFDLKRLPTKTRGQVRLLLEKFFLAKKENFLAFGNHGAGMTHILCTICQLLIRCGRRILFTKYSFLVQQLLTVNKNLKLSQFFKKHAKCEAVFIDDIGYVQQDREES